MKRLTALALVLVLAGGCTSAQGWPFVRPLSAPPPLLARADRLVEQGSYEAAVAAYDEFLATHADDGAMPRARMSRGAAAAVVAARAELAKLKQDSAKLTQEIAKLNEELVKREADLTKMREDLERLKQIDLLLEKRGKK
jgi:cell division protein FtsB